MLLDCTCGFPGWFVGLHGFGIDVLLCIDACGFECVDFNIVDCCF